MNPIKANLESILLMLQPHQSFVYRGIELTRLDSERYVSSTGTARYRPLYLVGDNPEPLLLLPAVDALAHALRQAATKGTVSNAVA